MAHSTTIGDYLSNIHGKVNPPPKKKTLTQVKQFAQRVCVNYFYLSSAKFSENGVQPVQIVPTLFEQTLFLWVFCWAGFPFMIYSCDPPPCVAIPSTASRRHLVCDTSPNRRFGKVRRHSALPGRHWIARGLARTKSARISAVAAAVSAAPRKIAAIRKSLANVSRS